MTEETQTTTCLSCKAMKSEVGQLKGKITKLKKKLATNQEQWVETFKEIQEQNRLLMVNTGKTAVFTNNNFSKMLHIHFTN